MRFILLSAVLPCLLLSATACDEGSYEPNPDPLQIESDEGAAEPSSETDLPTLSDIEQQEEREAASEE